MSHPSPHEPANERKTMPVEVQDRSSMRYFIMLTIIGAAFGNMFVARSVQLPISYPLNDKIFRKMKSFQNITTPFYKESNQSYATSAQAQKQFEEAMRRQAAEQQRIHERLRDYMHQQEAAEKIREQFQAQRARAPPVDGGQSRPCGPSGSRPRPGP